MPRVILRLQKDGTVSNAVITQIENFIDDKEAFLDYIMFKKIDTEETDTILREKHNEG